MAGAPVGPQYPTRRPPFRAPRTPWETGPVQIRPNELQTNTTAGHPWTPFYPSTTTQPAATTTGAGPTRQQPNEAGVYTNPGMSGLIPPPQAPPRVGNAQQPAQVPPIDVNAILAQWRSMMSPTLPREAEIPYIDDTAAVQAAMGRAKDTAGQLGRGAMDALMDLQGARGIVGSGLGINEAGGVIGAANQNLSDVNRGILEKSYDTELARQNANFGGRLTQRGQDIDQIGLNQNLLPMLTNLFGLKQSGLLQQRGQDMDFGLGQRGQDINQRGQDIDFGTTTRGQDITQRGQDMNLMEVLARLNPRPSRPFQY